MKPPPALLQLLDRHHVVYRLIHHPRVYTSQELAAILGVKGRQLAKVVALTDGTAFQLAVLPADHRIDFSRLPGQRLATEPEIRVRFPDCASGAVPPFGCLYAVPTLADESLPSTDLLAFEAGTHTDAIQLPAADYWRLAAPRRAAFAHKAP